MSNSLHKCDNCGEPTPYPCKYCDECMDKPYPEEMTVAPPGSKAKMQIMGDRASRGEILFHPDDSRVEVLIPYRRGCPSKQVRKQRGDRGIAKITDAKHRRKMYRVRIYWSVIHVTLNVGVCASLPEARRKLQSGLRMLEAVQRQILGGIECEQDEH